MLGLALYSIDPSQDPSPLVTVRVFDKFLGSGWDQASTTSHGAFMPDIIIHLHAPL